MSSNNRLTRSARIKKYESMYEICLSKIKQKKRIPPNKNTRCKRVNTTNELNKKEKKRKEEKRRRKEDIKKKEEKKKLNIYQKFVQEESMRKKYSGMDAKKRMTEIGKVWKKKKK